MSNNNIEFSIKKDIDSTELHLANAMSVEAAEALIFLLGSMKEIIKNLNAGEVKIKLKRRVYIDRDRRGQ